MNAKAMMQVSVVTTCLLMAGMATAGVSPKFGGPSTSSRIEIGCANPHKWLVVVRTGNATRVIQAGPQGVNWQVGLQSMRDDNDPYWLSPDGSAAVIAVSHAAGRQAYLVSEHHEPIAIAEGSVFAVDFQKNQVMVATGGPVDGESLPGSRVRVYDRSSGQILGDSAFQDRLAFSVTHDASKQFNLRLAEDGQSYYYIRWTRSAGDELVVRDVVSGRVRAIHDNFPARAVVVNNTSANVGIHDALLYADGGYVIAGGKLFTIRDEALVTIDVPDALGWPTRLVESADESRQAIVGSKGWGVFDTDTSRWIMIEPSSYTRRLQSSDGVITVLDLSRHASGIRTYDVSGHRPVLVRSFAGGELNSSTLACANAYGFMTYDNGKLDWHRMVQQP